MINLLTGIDSTASALDAERMRMDVIAQNIANANVTKGVDGKPYQRQEVVFESCLRAQQNSDSPTPRANGADRPRAKRRARRAMVYNPGHPDANANGDGGDAQHQYSRGNGRYDRLLALLRSQSGRGQERPHHGHAGALHRQTFLSGLLNGRSFRIKNGGPARRAACGQPAQDHAASAAKSIPRGVAAAQSRSTRTIRSNPSASVSVRQRRPISKMCWAVSSAKSAKAGGGRRCAVTGLLSGQNVSLHQAMISMEEANVSFQMMVEVRNRLLDSYQELMRMQI
jgi:flagellar basal body rod protein FlgB